MILDPIKLILTQLINADVAEIFSAPLATLAVLVLISMLFLLFANGHTKRLVLLFILITTLIYTTFTIAKNYGFVRLPIDVTNTETQVIDINEV